MFKVAAKPQSVGEILSGSFDLLKSIFMVVIPVVAGVEFVSAVVNALMAPAPAESVDQFVTNYFSNKSLLPAVVFFMLNVFVYAYVLFNAVFEARGDKANMNKAIQAAISKMVPLLIAGAIFLVLTYIGYFLFIIPGMILFTLLFLYSPAIVIDNKDGISALKMSAELVIGEFLHVLAVLAAVFVVFMIAGWVVMGIRLFLPGFIGILFTWVLNAAYTAFLPCLEFVLYNDLKLRAVAELSPES